jgi:hypothetical protein
MAHDRKCIAGSAKGINRWRLDSMTAVGQFQSLASDGFLVTKHGANVPNLAPELTALSNGNHWLQGKKQTFQEDQ